MLANLFKVALEYLQQDQVRYMDMISPIKRGTAQILYADTDGVLLHETKSGAYMMSVTNHGLGEVLLRKLPNNGLFVCHQDFMLEHFKAKIGHTHILENYQGAYLGEKLLSIPAHMDFKPLNIRDLDIVVNNYDMALGKEYLTGRILDEELFGGYENGEMIGFVGIHAEGSVGMLKVFNQHQFGTGLYTFITNHQLNRGLVPFGQVDVNNPASLHIARKLGFVSSNHLVYWLW